MNRPATTTRVLTQDDVEQYLQIRLEGLRVNPESFGTTYEETAQMTNPKEFWKKRLQPTSHVFTIGTFEGDSLISVATFVRENGSKFRHKGTIYAVYTTVSHRGKGIAKKLLQTMLDKVKSLEGLEQINLTVSSQNSAACALYRSLGFKVYGTEPKAMKHEGSYWDEDYMKLFL